MPGAIRSSLATFGRRFVISLAVTAVLTTGFVVAVNRGIDARVASIRRIKLTVAPDPPGGSNFLIIGSDTRQFAGDDPADEAAVQGQRSDTIMVAHVEPGSQRTFVVSFPRDLMVSIPGLPGKNRINQAYDTGGPSLLIQTLKANFGVDINHYLSVDFESFAKVVDAIGTVKVYLPGIMRDQESGFKAPFGEGCYPLNGAASLAYVRSRTMEIEDPNGLYADSGAPDPNHEQPGPHWRLVDVRADLDRIQRQQSFIRELASVAVSRSLGDPFLAAKVADNVLGYLTTDQNLTRGDVDSLIRAFRTIDVNNPNAVRFETLPVDPDPSNPNVTLVPREPDATQVAQELGTFGSNAPPPPAEPSQVHIQVADGTGTGLASPVADALRAQGFVLDGIAAPRADVAVTQIRYGTEHADAAKALLAYLPDAALVPDKALNGKRAVLVVVGHSFQSVSVPVTTTTLPGAAVAPTTTTVPPTTTTQAPTTTTRGPDTCHN